jgi:hypothetical protein
VAPCAGVAAIYTRLHGYQLPVPCKPAATPHREAAEAMGWILSALQHDSIRMDSMLWLTTSEFLDTNQISWSWGTFSAE